MNPPPSLSQSTRFRRLEEVFCAALEVPEHERAARVAELCGSDRELAAEVTRLLAVRAQTRGTFLSPAARLQVSADDFTAPAEDDWTGRCIDGFTLVRRLAVGGMGAVYEATQQELRRSVALKLMRGALLDADARRRFAREAQILAEVRHPHIAQVYASGTYRDAGVDVPYIAMELVPGAVGLLTHADQQRLGLRDRLRLFLTVCDAVLHGHQRGVIHRDLKPANLLVDESGHVKVIDFGVARMLERGELATTARTDARHIIGTLPHLSPEQLAGDARVADVRSDVYALGVVLYELLSGRLPYDIRNESLARAAEIVRTQAPAPLSAVHRTLRGDLQTIVFKALEKELDRRYSSVEALAEDIRRYLSHEPILARPPSARYQLRKFAQRNRALVAGVMVALVVALIGAGTTAWKVVEATREGQRAQLAARKAERIAWFLQTVLSSADPRLADADVTIRDALDYAAARADAELAEEPEVLSDVHALVGSIYVRMKQSPLGERHLRKALALRRELYGDSNCIVAETMTDLAWALDADHLDEVEQLFTDALKIRRTLYGDDDASVAVAKTQVAAAKSLKGRQAEAVTLLNEALPVVKRELGPQHTAVGFALATLANCLQIMGETAAAEVSYREAIAVRRVAASPPELADTLSNFAKFLKRQGREEEAVPFAAEAAEIRARRLGPGAAPCEEP